MKNEEMRLRQQKIGEDMKNEEMEKKKIGLKKSGMPYSILKKVYDRGMAGWKGETYLIGNDQSHVDFR